MQKTTGAQADPTLLGGWYGQSKTHKTSTALYAPPSMRPVAFLDTDRGARLRLKLLTMPRAQRDKLEVVESVPEYAGDWMKKDIDFYNPGFDEQGRPCGNYWNDCFEFAASIASNYKLVVVDTLSTMATQVLKEVVSYDYGGTSKDTKRLSVGKGKAATVHPIMSDYGFAQDRVFDFITMLDEQPCHVVLISHERTGEIKDAESTKRILAGPRTIGTAQLEMIPAMMDVVLRFENRFDGRTKTNQAYVRSRNHNFYLAGDRSGLFADGLPLDPKNLWDRLIQMIGMSQADVAQAVAAQETKA